MNTKPDKIKSKIDENYDCTRDIYDAVAESTIFKDYLGDGKLQLTDAHTYVKKLCVVEKFVQAVLSTTKPAFEITGSSKPTRLNLGNHFIKLFDMPDRKTIQSKILTYRLSPNVNLYFDTLPGVGIKFTDPNIPDHSGKLQAEYFNEFIVALRENSKCMAYQDEQKGRRKQAADNHKSLAKYVNTLLDKDHYTQLVVIRLDLAYINDYKNLVSIDVAIAHREKLLGNRYHNKIFENVVGYAWGLQYLVGKGGYYNHIFIFLDTKTLPDNSWYVAISDYWSGITDGKGRCQNCDKGIHKYNYPGVGIIKRGNSVDFVERAASFLSKKELFFSLKYGNNEKKFRTYDKGKVPAKVQRYDGHNQN